MSIGIGSRLPSILYVVSCMVVTTYYLVYVYRQTLMGGAPGRVDVRMAGAHSKTISNYLPIH